MGLQQFPSMATTAVVKGGEHFGGVDVQVEFDDPEVASITQRKETSFEPAIRESLEHKLGA